MKILLKTLLTSIFSIFGILVYAQEKIAPLKIGDKLPDLVLQHIINSNQKIDLSSLHQQDLFIINFWATWCGPCIRELPVLDSMVAINQGKLKVLSVAYEKYPVVSVFLKKHPKINTSHLVITTDDKILVKYFKHIILPHNIWIDRNGIIKSITGEEEINSKNISSFMSKRTLKMETKKDIVNFDIFSPFHLRDSVFIYRSILSEYVDGILGGRFWLSAWKHPTERWITRLFSSDQSRQQILWLAIDGLKSTQDYYGVMKIETNDSTRFFWPRQCPKTFTNSKYKSKLDWEKENAFCYELSLPRAVKDSVFFEYIKNDLERMFQVEITQKAEIIPTCVLTLEQGHTFAKPENDSSYITLTARHLQIHNMTIINIYNYLNDKMKVDRNDKPDDPPYVDETGIKTRVDIDLDFLNDNPTFRQVKNLIEEKYGIVFSVIKHPYQVTYIKDLVP